MFNKRKVRKLEEELRTAQASNIGLKFNLGLVTGELKDAIADRDEWRKKFELLYHTPEVKADIESAFTRGTDHATTQFKAWLFDAAQNLSLKKDVTND